MDESLRITVRFRARQRCEYCLMPENAQGIRFSIDHIVPRKHGGGDAADNLALSCVHCNLHKGTNLSGIDPHSGAVVRLFDPRKDVWSEHFYWDGAKVTGASGCGRATVIVLNMNGPERLRLRKSLMDEGSFSAPE